MRSLYFGYRYMYLFVFKSNILNAICEIHVNISHLRQDIIEGILFILIIYYFNMPIAL